MTRLKIVLFASLAAAFGYPGAAKADRYYAGPPVAQALSLSIQLSREAAALSHEVDQVLCDCKDYDDVLDELRDVAEEMCDLNRSLRRAYFNPRRWDRVCKRAEDVEEELCELDEEIHEAVERLNRHRSRRTAFVPVGPAAYRTSYRSAPHASFSIRIGNHGRLMLASAPSRHLVSASGPYLGPAQGYSPVPTGYELLDRVHRMQAIAKQLRRLAH